MLVESGTVLTYSKWLASIAGKLLHSVATGNNVWQFQSYWSRLPWMRQAEHSWSCLYNTIQYNTIQYIQYNTSKHNTNHTARVVLSDAPVQKVHNKNMKIHAMLICHVCTRLSKMIITKSLTRVVGMPCKISVLICEFEPCGSQSKGAQLQTHTRQLHHLTDSMSCTLNFPDFKYTHNFQKKNKEVKNWPLYACSHHSCKQHQCLHAQGVKKELEIYHYQILKTLMAGMQTINRNVIWHRTFC